MRIAVGENPEAFRHRAFLDGVEVTNECFVADEEEGYVHLYLRNKDGRILYTQDRKAFAWERRDGVVRIEPM